MPILPDDLDEIHERLHPDSSAEPDSELPIPSSDDEEGSCSGSTAQPPLAAAAAAAAPLPASLAELESEAKAKGYGKLYAAMGGGREGLEACVAVEALCEVNAIEKLLSGFIVPLQKDNISTTDPQVGLRAQGSGLRVQG